MSRTDPPAPSPRPTPRSPPAAAPAPPGERVFAGIAIAPGIGIGPVFGAAEPAVTVTRQKIVAADIAAEGARLEEAVARSRRQLLKLRARLDALPEEGSRELAPLIEAYLRMLDGSRLLRGARARIATTLIRAESAVAEEAEAICGVILAMEDPDRAAQERRAAEVREIAARILRNLTRQPFQNFAGLPEGAVLVREALRPADAALLDPGRLAGVATEEGGAEGHTAIMLRALGVPAVLGVAGLAAAARPGQVVLVDGGAGQVVLDPSPPRLAAARRAASAYARENQRLARLRRLPAVTTDGAVVMLQANLEIPAELPLVTASGAHGIGLLRSEFLFMNREGLPDEDAQTAVYRSIIEAIAPDPVTIRVLDWGGEKEIDALAAAGVVAEAREINPALGLRGIRLLLRAPALFETQLAAILRAAVAGPTSVLLPMITHLSELHQARAIYERVARRLRRRGERIPERLPPLGVMIETPGAALAADALALEADFLAIGTNDLSMYTLAVDRGAAELAGLYDPLHPAVLRLVQFATEAGLRMRKPVSVCGEMGANPAFTALLLGLGLRRFSINAPAVPRVKQAVRAASIEGAVRLARRVMDESDPARIRAHLAAAQGGSGPG